MFLLNFILCVYIITTASGLCPQKGGDINSTLVSQTGGNLRDIVSALEGLNANAALKTLGFGPNLGNLISILNGPISLITGNGGSDEAGKFFDTIAYNFKDLFNVPNTGDFNSDKKNEIVSQFSTITSKIFNFIQFIGSTEYINSLDKRRAGMIDAQLKNLIDITNGLLSKDNSNSSCWNECFQNLFEETLSSLLRIFNDHYSENVLDITSHNMLEDITEDVANVSDGIVNL